LIGPQSSTLKYKISNPSAAPAAATLTLPLPDLDFSDPDASWSIPAPDPINFVGVTAKQDQKPAPLNFSQSAQLDGKDVTSKLQRAGLSLVPVGAFHNQLAAMSADARSRLAQEGLISEAGVDQAGNPIYYPRWSVKTSGVRKLDLAPGQSAVLEYKFRTSVGVSRDTVLREPLRSQKSLSQEVERRRADFCLDRAFLSGVDKIVSTKAERLTRPPEPIPGPAETPPPDPLRSPTPSPSLAADPPKPPAIRVFPEANVANLREMRISFDIGGDGAGAKQFHLTVDKGKPDRLISFCMDNLKKTSPTGFEMRASDYHPAVPLKILMVGPQN
jgi:hypothetical protein